MKKGHFKNVQNEKRIVRAGTKKKTIFGYFISLIDYGLIFIFSFLKFFSLGNFYIFCNVSQNK